MWIRLRVCLTVMVLFFAQSVHAQQGEILPSAEAANDVALTEEFSVPTSSAQIDDVETTWADVSTAAEDAVSRDDSSLFALNRLRIQILDWRDLFLSQQGTNAERLATLDAQIAALDMGISSDNGSETADSSGSSFEADEVTKRRTELLDKRAAASAPAALAAEHLAHANGLLHELDTQISELERAALTTRGPTPLNPVHWGAALLALAEGLTNFGREGAARLEFEARTGGLLRNAPGAVLLMAVAFWIFWNSRRWLTVLGQTAVRSNSRWEPVLVFIVGFLQLALPLFGLFLFVVAVRRLDLFGLTGEAVITGGSAAATVAIFARWLAAEFFPKGERSGPLGKSEKDRDEFRRLTFLLGLGIAGITLVEVLMGTTNAESISVGVVLFPINLLAAFVLFRFGRKLRASGGETENATEPGRISRLVGFLCMAVAIIVPLLIAAGYAYASNALFRPFVLSMALVGFMMLLQNQISRSWAIYRGNATSQGDTLAPVVVGFVLVLISGPLLALLWGASNTDLIEWWGRFQSGLRIGDTRISPSDFLSFVLVFAVGYLLTGFIQSFLKGTILPRTSIDIGGRNAIVAGVGYVGIILAAVIAIDSAGVDLSSIALVAGALSVGIGFGLQNVVSNFVSGIILLIERPVSEGDWIEVNGHMGYVRRISVRSTQIETFDRTDIIIPNADLASVAVTNWTRGNSVGRVIVPIGVAYESDTEQVMGILKDVAMSHPMVLHYPEPTVLFISFGDSALNFEIRAILRDVNFILSVQSELNLEISKRFRDAGIEIPFPQRDLWLRNAEDLKAGSQGTKT